MSTQTVAETAAVPRRAVRSGWLTVLYTAGAGLLSLGGLFGLILGEVYLNAWALTGLAFCYALVTAVVFLFVAGIDIGCQAAVAVWVLAGLAWLPGASAAVQLPLVLHGRTTDAVVVSVEHTVVDRDQRWYSTLRRPDGAPVPGPRLLDRDNRLHPGDTVRVVFDPDGVVGPRRPGDIHPARDAGWSIGFAALLLGAVGWAGWYGHREREHPRRTTAPGPAGRPGRGYDAPTAPSEPSAPA
ncbi:hypothetical protein ABH930_004959 [Kitasatospora sp. GAS204A]|uniref:hypothetical protein n=1 Tax=unclassified Kitasatospora TaxID=2633591 RepID=UPI002473D1C6|nr:hypothetical protein [Kitasatospora sp. GAS204B]MDH6120888.1 hypothetical protein [Kitasatospora sp. GAS204B]